MKRKMNREILNTAYAEISNFKNKFGEVLLDEIEAEDNSTYEMAKGVITTFSMCKNQGEFDIADNMLIAICGWSFETLVSKIKEREAAEFQWESC